ncbi:MAG: glycosyltransferase family 4 protein [Coriobacteriia bacterium]|nr:glycosyltransferase family 4 protein [Coriobacteriia bacterium]
MKRIAIVYSGARHWGGVETYLESLFKNVDASRVDVMLLSLGRWPLSDRLKDRAVLFSESRLRPKTVVELRKYLVDNGSDLVVSQGTVANAYARAAAWLSGIPSLVTVHSIRESDYSSPIVSGLYALIDQISRFPTRTYIAVSNHVRGYLIDAGIDSARIKVIYNGVGFQPETGAAVRRQFGEGGEVVIGSIGRLHTTKGYSNLIRAVSLLGEARWRLEIAGEGDERGVLEREIAELGLSDKIKLLGHVDEISELFVQWDIYVQPSVMEGFGLTVVEAMLAGKPVVITPVGSLPELVADGRTGVVAKSTAPEAIAVALERLIHNPEMACELAQAGKDEAQRRFAVSKWVEETQDAYLEAAR